MSKSLLDYGHIFQLKTISCLLTDNKFIDRIYDIIDYKFYESEANQWIVQTIIEYYKKYKSIPTKNVFEIEIQKISKNIVLKKLILDNLLVIYNSYNDLNYIKDEFLNFCKNKELENALKESIDLFELAQYENIKKRMDKAFNSGLEKNIGSVWKEKEYFNRRVEETLRNPLSTPWDQINSLTNGGLGSGEFGVVVAPSGRGKSWILIAIGAHNIRNGKTVIHYTLELSEDYVGLRYDANLSGFLPQTIKDHQAEVFHQIGKIKGNLVIKYFPAKNAGIDTLRSHVNSCINFGIKPDLIIVDYPDLLYGNSVYSKYEKRFEVDNIYDNIRGLAGEFQIPIWGASQTNRSALDDEFIDEGRLAESYGKVMVADFVMTLQRTNDDKKHNHGRIFIPKNRFGVDGLLFPAEIDASRGFIKLFDEKSEDGKRIKTELDNSKQENNDKQNEKILELLLQKPLKKIDIS